MGAAALCLKLPQTMTSNNHRECGAGGRKKGRENGECDQWLTFQDDWHRLKTLPVSPRHVGLQSRTFVGSWGTIRKQRRERRKPGILGAEKNDREWNSSLPVDWTHTGEWNYNYCKTSLVCKINYLRHDFYQNNSFFQHSVQHYFSQTIFIGKFFVLAVSEHCPVCRS